MKESRSPSQSGKAREKETRGDRARGMQDDLPVTHYRRGSGGEEKTAGSRER